LSALVSRLSTVVGQVVALSIISRGYGSRAIDGYSFALALALFGALFIDFGTGLRGTREVAAGTRLAPSALARLPFAAVVVIAVALLSVAGRLTSTEAGAVAALAVAQAASALAKGIFWGSLRFGREAMFAIGEVALLAVLLAIGASAAGALPGPMACCALAYVTGAVARWAFVPAHLRPAGSAVRFRAWLSDTAAYGLQSLTVTASAQLDLVILALLVSSRETGVVGAYALGLRVYYAAPMPIESFAAALLPRFVTRESNRVRSSVAAGGVASIGAVSAMAAFVVAAPWLGFHHDVVGALRNVTLILALGMPFRCMAYICGAWLTARGYQRRRFVASATALATMLLLDFALIPTHAASGAAIAMVAADGVLFLGYGLATWSESRGVRTLETAAAG
jgi:O-antigen/teichoic acid export membrane protein